MTNQTKNSMLLMLCALIWGTAFVAQSAGSGMGAFSFLAGRSWMAVLVLIPTVKAFDALHHRQGRPDGKPKTAAERKLLLKAGLVCGTLLFLASAACNLLAKKADRRNSLPGGSRRKRIDGGKSSWCNLVID